MSAEFRKAVLAEATEYVCKDRQSSYGTPEDNFSNIAAFWNTYLLAKYKGGEIALTAVDVALMMDLLKSARLMHNPTHRDSWVDKAGYSACGADIALAPSITYTEPSNLEESTTPTNKFKIGNFVWHPVHGRGKVTVVDFSTVSNFPYEVFFEENNHLRPFTADGRGRAGYADDYIELEE
jgi:hypothetical protein